jgi:hypothetical protein
MQIIKKSSVFYGRMERRDFQRSSLRDEEEKSLEFYEMAWCRK